MSSHPNQNPPKRGCRDIVCGSVIISTKDDEKLK